jgi:hypothetical protein
MAQKVCGRSPADDRQIQRHPDMFRNAGFTGTAQQDPVSRNELIGVQRKPNCWVLKG